MNIYILLLILFIHWIFDFIIQTREQALNKHKSFKALLSHTTTYSSGFLILLFFIGFKFAGIFALVTLISHTAIDYFTSKGNHFFWESKQHRKFWTLLGFDQFIHAAQLILTYYWLS